MGPEESMQIQSNLASTIAMAFDECPSSVADRGYVQRFCRPDHTDGLQDAKKKWQRLNSLEDTINQEPAVIWYQPGCYL